jgi:glycosyltransferase involved in cell wall biosynthesis
VSAAPKVSVLVVAYNQVRYIAQALESVLSQRASFPFEVIVGDDCSTDGTRELVRAYADAHPDRIRAALHPVNLGGLGARNFLSITSLARGEYLSVLEGDDIFTDPEKLQIQASFLDTNADCAGCFHECAVIDADGGQLEGTYPLKVRAPRVTREDVILNGNNSVTNTRMYRRSCVESYPGWYLAHTMDWGLEILVAGHGDWGFISRKMSAYRRHDEGVYSGAGLRQRHQILIDMAEVLLLEPGFSGFKEPLRRRLAWMNREIAISCRKAADRKGYLKHLARFVRYSRKDLTLLKSLVKAELLQWA